jgi:hypothetical protein
LVLDELKILPRHSEIPIRSETGINFVKKVLETPKHQGWLGLILLGLRGSAPVPTLAEGIAGVAKLQKFSVGKLLG